MPRRAIPAPVPMPRWNEEVLAGLLIAFGAGALILSLVIQVFEWLHV